MAAIRDVVPGTRRPGGSAAARYHALHKEWRESPRVRRVRFATSTVCAILLVVGVRLDEPLAFNVGFFAGAAAVFWLAVRDLAAPEYIQRWRRGAEGEKWTAKELAKLDSEWQVRHDLQGRHGNVDHIVTGPAGVFLLDSKAWLNGTTTATREGPVVRADHDPDLEWRWAGLPGRMRGAAAAMSDALRKLSQKRFHVQPVVVIWGHYPDGVQERQGVTYVAGERLHDWLSSLPRRLSDDDLRTVHRLS